MLRTSKRYIITSNGLNNQYFRVLTDGIDRQVYDQNPILLFMHFRATGSNKNEVLPLGRVEDIQVDKDGVMTCVLCFDDTDEFAKTIYNKYENGTMNMLSIGVLPLEWSEDPDDMIAGQLYATITKSVMKEVSCCDIGMNPEALPVALYDKQGNLITLSDGKSFADYFPRTNSQTDMKITLNPAASALLKLSDSATDADALGAIQRLVTLADTQAAEIVTLKSGKETAEDLAKDLKKQLDDQIALSSKEKINGLVDKAVSERKITEAQKALYVTLAEKDFDNTKAILDSMTGSASVAAQLKDKDSGNELAELEKKTFDELFESGKLATLKDRYPDTYKAKFKEKFGKEPK